MTGQDLVSLILAIGVALFMTCVVIVLVAFEKNRTETKIRNERWASYLERQRKQYGVAHDDYLDYWEGKR